MDALPFARGMIAGLAGTGGMTLIELAARSRWGVEVLLDWRQNEAIAHRIRKRPLLPATRLGMGLHFLHGLLAGLVFVVAVPFLPSGIPTEVLGLGYGVVLAAITVGLHRAITGESPGAGRRGWGPLPITLLTHAAYGVILSLLVVWP